LIEWLRIDGVQDAQELKEWIEAMKKKAEITQEEINRLNGKLAQQDSRIEELRDMHRLESSSQSELIDNLRQKVGDAEAQASAAQSSLQTERALLAAERSTRESLIAAERAKHSTDLTDLDILKAKLKEAEADVEKSKGVAKEEEEKRTKAISLLKTVRTKLVKAEKERDDLQLQMNEAKNVEGKGEEEVRSLKNELEGLNNELERVRRESEREIERVREEAKWEVEKRRRQLENDMASARDAMERDILARRGEWEIEGIAAKVCTEHSLLS
jgi:chromosome segregation ATPase